MTFAGKVILITGASSGIRELFPKLVCLNLFSQSIGIAAACAEHFAKEGAKLSLIGRNASKIEKAINRIKEIGIKMEPLIILADVSVDAKRIINETAAKYGQIDVLVNNAAFSIPAPIESIKKENVDAFFATNVWGLIEMTQLSIRYLITTKGNVVKCCWYESISWYCCLKQLFIILHFATQWN